MMEKRQPLQQILLGKLDICMQKTETRYLSSTPQEYKLNMGNDCLSRTEMAHKPRKD
jgi:hypothetical protein